MFGQVHDRCNRHIRRLEGADQLLNKALADFERRNRRRGSASSRDLAKRQRAGAGPAPSCAHNQKGRPKFPAICKPRLPWHNVDLQLIAKQIRLREPARESLRARAVGDATSFRRDEATSAIGLKVQAGSTRATLDRRMGRQVVAEELLALSPA